MADLALLTGATGAEPIWPEKAKIKPVIAGETVANAQAAYLASTGKYGLADANASGKHQFRGIFLQAAGAGQATSLLERGAIGGYDVSGMAYDAPVYLSDTAGALADAAGTATVIVGRVVPMSDKDLTKVIDIDVSYITVWP
jgi:hypothetical protein